MGDADNMDDEDIVLNLVDHAVLAYADSPSIILIR